MKPTSNRIRQNDPEGLRTRVLNAAADLFQVRGYHATSMKDLMQVTGVSGGALHHLALAVIADRVAPDVRRTWIDPIRTAPSLAKGIAGVFAAIISGVDARGRVAGCPLNNLAVELALSDADFRSAIDAVFVEWQSALVERIAETRGGARLDRAKRTDAAAFIVSVYSGAMTLAKSKQNTLSLRSAASVLLHWLREREFAAESAA
jgi:AcrR family transcriptional regulator